MNPGYAEQVDSKRKDCNHCKGSGKCTCLSCRSKFADERNLELKDLPDGEVNCSICDGTGNFFYSIRKAMWVNPMGFFPVMQGSHIPDLIEED